MGKGAASSEVPLGLVESWLTPREGYFQTLEPRSDLLPVHASGACFISDNVGERTGAGPTDARLCPRGRRKLGLLTLTHVF